LLGRETWKRAIDREVKDEEWDSSRDDDAIRPVSEAVNTWLSLLTAAELDAVVSMHASSGTWWLSATLAPALASAASFERRSRERAYHEQGAGRDA